MSERERDRYRDRERDREYREFRERDRTRDNDRGYRRESENERDRNARPPSIDNKYYHHHQQQHRHHHHNSSRNHDINKEEENKRLRELKNIDKSRREIQERDEEERFSKMTEEERYGKKRFERDAAGDKQDNEQGKQKKKKEQADYKPSGVLIDDLKMKSSGTQSVSSAVSSSSLKWTEPHEARLPSKRFVLYPFKDGKSLDPYHLHRQKSYLIGRDRDLVDIPTDHPSCSSQHAVIVYRLVNTEVDGETVKIIRPYLLDLESTNGTILNGKKVGTLQYIELRSRDMIKFGLSTREYILLQEDESTSSDDNSDDDDNDD